MLSEHPDQRLRFTAASFSIIIDGVCVTRLFDNQSKTVRDCARLPLYPIAEWFAVNWWRLHAEAPYETGGRPTPDWLLSHDLGAVGSGFIWPRIRFSSDNSTMQVSAKAFRNAPWEPIRYLNDVPPKSIPNSVFDTAIESLILLVIARLQDLNISAEPLRSIWSDVVAERLDPEAADWRLWEARLGYDPDQAPQELMTHVVHFSEVSGQEAAVELAPVLAEREIDTINSLLMLAESPGVDAKAPDFVDLFITPQGIPPWEAGRVLAQSVRSYIGRRDGPLDDRTLGELLGLRPNSLDKAHSSGGTVGLGVRRSGKNSMTLHFRRRNLPGMRFEAARFLSESLAAPKADIWLPLTDRATARQKLQRAFAAEFLAPIHELQELMADWKSPERFEEAGDYYGISPLAIRSHLANHGLLAPEEVIM